MRQADVRDIDAVLLRDRAPMVSRDDPPTPDGNHTSTPAGRPRRLKVSELLAGEREAILEHDGQDYRLRITANGKLILTK